MIRTERHRQFALAFCLLALSVVSPATLADNPLNSLLWKHRVILIDDSEGDSRAEARFELAKTYIADRHIVWFVLGNNSYVSNWKADVPEGFAKSLRHEYFSKANTGSC